MFVTFVFIYKHIYNISLRCEKIQVNVVLDFYRVSVGF